MTTYVANAVVDVLRGSAATAYGDPADTDVVVAVGVPIALTQQMRRSSGGKNWSTLDERPASGVERSTNYHLGRAPTDTDIRDGDRLRMADGRTYLVEGVADSSGVGLAPDLRLDLTRIT